MKNVIWTVEGKIRDGQRVAYESLMEEMVEEVHKEVGTTHYEWTIAEDDETIQVYERYENTEAALKHLETWGKFAERYMKITEIRKFIVYSDLDQVLREAVAGLKPIYMKPMGGFSK